MWGHSDDLWVSCTKTIFRVGGLYWSLSQAEFFRTGCSCLSAQMDKAQSWHNHKEADDVPSWNGTCSPPLGTLIAYSYSAFFSKDSLMTWKPSSLCLSSPFLLDYPSWDTRAQLWAFKKAIAWLSYFGWACHENERVAFTEVNMLQEIEGNKQGFFFV